MCNWRNWPLVLIVLVLAPAASFADMPDFGLGRAPTDAEVAAWDIDVRPDGQGLPAGEGTALDGEPVYLERCAVCHGEFAEGAGRYPVLMGGEDTLKSEDPVKTIGSYWPYTATLFDYIYRAMPFGDAQSLTADETYAVTAYILYLNDLIEEDEAVNQENLAAIELPNHAGFIDDNRPHLSTGKACMVNCKENVEIKFKAKRLDVTPTDEDTED